jgi:putative oxidoreductase
VTSNSTIATLLTKSSIPLLSISLLLLRCTVGIILFVIGAGKVLGWFGGKGLEPTVQMFVANIGIPAFLAYLSCFTEFIGGFLLIVGFLTRPAAIAVAINMAVATAVLLPKGFFMGGAAYPFSLLVSSVIILLAGPMAFSLDSLFLRPSVGTSREEQP